MVSFCFVGFFLKRIYLFTIVDTITFVLWWLMLIAHFPTTRTQFVESVWFRRRTNKWWQQKVCQLFSTFRCFGEKFEKHENSFARFLVCLGLYPHSFTWSSRWARSFIIDPATRTHTSETHWSWKCVSLIYKCRNSRKRSSPVHNRILCFAKNRTVKAVFVRHSSDRKGGSATTTSKKCSIFFGISKGFL